MTDPDLTPAQDGAVRALLAAAKHTDPAPPHVVARLDETLATLVSERREARAPVVTLASRRRRTASSVLLAAAAAVVFGVGITQFVPSISESGSDSGESSAESLQDQTTTRSEGSSGAQESDSPEGSGTALDQSQRSTRENAPLSSTSADDAGLLTSTTALKPQVRRLRPAAPSTSTFLADPACLVDRGDFEDHVSVTYNGLPGVLVYRPPLEGRQQVDVYLCGEPGLLRSVQLRAR